MSDDSASTTTASSGSAPAAPETQQAAQATALPPTAPPPASASLQARLDGLIKLAHGNPQEREQYANRQSEVESLVRDLNSAPKEMSSSSKPSPAAQEALKPDDAAKTQASSKTTPEATVEEVDPDTVPDDVSGYRIELPPSDMPRGEIDQHLVGTAMAVFHDARATQGQVSLALKALAAIEARQATVAAEKADVARAELRELWGESYDAEVKRANDWVRENNLPKSWLAARLDDGRLLGSDPEFIKWVHDRASEGPGSPNPSPSGDNLIRPHAFESRVEAVDREINELVSLAHSDKPGDRRRYAASQGRLSELIRESARLGGK